jgi:hypothetical protein
MCPSRSLMDRNGVGSANPASFIRTFVPSAPSNYWFHHLIQLEWEPRMMTYRGTFQFATRSALTSIRSFSMWPASRYFRTDAARGDRLRGKCDGLVRDSGCCNVGTLDCSVKILVLREALFGDLGSAPSATPVPLAAFLKSQAKFSNPFASRVEATHKENFRRGLSALLRVPYPRVE